MPCRSREGVKPGSCRRVLPEGRKGARRLCKQEGGKERQQWEGPCLYASGRMMYPARHGPDAVLFGPAADSLKNISESICHEENARHPDDPGARLLFLRSRPECDCPADRSGGGHGSGPCRPTRPPRLRPKMWRQAIAATRKARSITTLPAAIIRARASAKLLPPRRMPRPPGTAPARSARARDTPRAGRERLFLCGRARQGKPFLAIFSGCFAVINVAIRGVQGLVSSACAGIKSRGNGRTAPGLAGKPAS